MTIKIIAIAIFSILINSSFLFADAKIQINEGNEINWGKVKKSQEVLYKTITIKNIGDKLLILENLRPGCDCTKAKADKNSLKPGESTKVTVSLELRDDLGPHKKLLDIISNASNSPELRVLLIYDVETPLDIEPLAVELTNVVFQQNANGTSTIKNKSKVPIKITMIEKDIPSLEVSTIENTIIKPGKSLVVNFKLLMQYKSNVKTLVRFHTDHPDLPHFDFKVFGVMKN